MSEVYFTHEHPRRLAMRSRADGQVLGFICCVVHTDGKTLWYCQDRTGRPLLLSAEHRVVPGTPRVFAAVFDAIDWLLGHVTHEPFQAEQLDAAALPSVETFLTAGKTGIDVSSKALIPNQVKVPGQQARHDNDTIEAHRTLKCPQTIRPTPTRPKGRGTRTHPSATR